MSRRESIFHWVEVLRTLSQNFSRLHWAA